MNDKDFRILSRDEVRAALRFEGPPRPPLAQSLWQSAEIVEAHGEAWEAIKREFPDDVLPGGFAVSYWNAPADDPNYRWAFGDKQYDPQAPIDKWDLLSNWGEDFEQFLAEFPDPHRPGADAHIRRTREAHPDRYILSGWGHFFHQRLAYMRGMENLMFDFYEHQDELHRFMDALMGFYAVAAERCAAAGADGVWAGDDLGHQTGLFMSPELFRAVYKPHYTQLAEVLHAHGLDFWLHSCGHITPIIPDLVEAGVDALHPIQVGTMDDQTIVREFGGRIAFWVGMDVQHLIVEGTPDEVRRGVRERMELFYRPEGGLILASGNSLLPDTPLENIRAYAETIRTPLGD